MTFTSMVKSTALAGTLGLGVLVATASGASAHYTTTRCDSDGDRCWTVRCDDDGDDCRRTSSYNNYSGYNRYNYRSRYGYNNGNSYSDRRDGYWRCDREGDDCHWIRRDNYNRDYNRDYNREYNGGRY